MDIKQLLEEYKKITSEILGKVKKNEDIDELISKRKNVVDLIVGSDCNKVQGKAILEELKIEELDKELQNEIEKLKLDTKIEIKKIKQTRNINDKYSNFGKQAYIFSTKR